MTLEKLVRSLRQFRTYHKLFGVGMAAFILITATTGIILGWKKNLVSIQPETKEGTSNNLNDWVSFDEVAKRAYMALDSLKMGSNEIDRFDVRVDKGMIKVLFKEGYWEVQVDGKSGKVLSVARRHSDWIEHIHDGSIFSDVVKIFYTNLLGISLLTLATTGLWMWYGPKVVRKRRNL